MCVTEPWHGLNVGRPVAKGASGDTSPGATGVRQAREGGPAGQRVGKIRHRELVARLDGRAVHRRELAPIALDDHAGRSPGRPRRCPGVVEHAVMLDEQHRGPGRGDVPLVFLGRRHRVERRVGVVTADDELSVRSARSGRGAQHQHRRPDRFEPKIRQGGTGAGGNDRPGRRPAPTLWPARSTVLARTWYRSPKRRCGSEPGCTANVGRHLERGDRLAHGRVRIGGNVGIRVAVQRGARPRGGQRPAVPAGDPLVDVQVGSGLGNAGRRRRVVDLAGRVVGGLHHGELGEALLVRASMATAPPGPNR